MDTLNEALGLKIPQHVAVILDGNGRWAKQRHMPRTYGHKVGSKVVEDMLTVVDDLGVKYFTVYAFSTENWKRSTEEVSTLMTILRTYLKDCVKKSMKNNVRCRVIGRREELSADIIESIENLEQKTKNNTGLQFTIAINYGGRDEITRAVRKLATKVSNHELAPEDITEEMISKNLDTLHGTTCLFLYHPFDVVVVRLQVWAAEVRVYPLLVVSREFGHNVDFGFTDITHIFGSPSIVSLA